MKSNFILVLAILLCLFFGCTSINSEQAIMLNESIQNFLSTHPNADVKINLIKSNELASFEDEIFLECDKNLLPNDYYRVRVADPVADLRLTLWIEKDSLESVCAHQEGKTAQSDTNTIFEDDQIGLSCVDSDSNFSVDQRYYVQGIAQGYPDTVQGASYDCCKQSMTGGPCGNTGKYLSEAVCLGETPSNKIYECEVGCQAGACIKETICEDSDGGTNYYSKGTLTKNNAVKEDYCWKDDSDSPKESMYVNFLREYSCFYPDLNDFDVESVGGDENAGYYEINYNCLNGCQAGKCLVAIIDQNSGDDENNFIDNNSLADDSLDCGNNCVTKPDINSLLKEKQLEVKSNLIKTMQFNEQNYFSFTDSESQNEPGFSFLVIDSNNNANFDTFDEIKQVFLESVFLMDSNKSFTAVNESVANIIQNIYFSNYVVGEYDSNNFYAYNFSFNEKNNQKILTLLNTSLQRAGNNFEFITINNCGENSCSGGTLALNYPLSNLTDSEIDSLPKIIAKDLMSGDGTIESQKIEGSISIINKSDLKIEIPLRFFKAIFETRKYAINLKNLSEQVKGLDCNTIFNSINDVMPIGDSSFEKGYGFNYCQSSSSAVVIDLIFKELNSLYLVSPDDQNRIIAENNYKIRITKSYPSN